jgi:hypothetical protein
MLLDDWGCPAVSKATPAINQLDTLSDEESRDYQFTEVIGLATALTTATLAEEGERQRLLPSLLLSAARSGIDGEDLRTVFTEVVSQWQEWGDLLELPTQDVSPFRACEPNRNRHSSEGAWRIAMSIRPFYCAYLRRR